MTFIERSDRVVEEARTLASNVNNWADFAAAVFGPEDSLIARAFPEETERQMFQSSSQYKTLSEMRLHLINKFGAEKGGTPEKSGRVLIRIPKSLHKILEVEAKKEGVSLNQLAVSKLAIPLEDRVVDASLTLIAQAFAKVHDGYSVDRVVADPELNLRFLGMCRKLGCTQPYYDLNHSLFDIRKSGKIELPKATKRTEFRNYDEFQFAAEIAARVLQRAKGVSLDQIICDPELALEFDGIAMQLAPKYSRLQLRCAALNLRKTRKLRPLAETESETMDRSVNLIGAGPLKLLVPEEMPSEPGVYSLFDANRPIFAGQTDDLQQRMERHREGHMPTWLGLDDSLMCTVKYAPMPSEKSKPQREEWLYRFINRERPLLNVQSDVA